MPSIPDPFVSRREALAAVGGLAVGAAGGYVVGARPDRTGTSPEPLVYGPTEWPMTDYDAAHTRHVPAASRPDGDLREDWRVEHTAEADYDSVVGNGAVYTLVSDEPDTGAVRAVRLADGREVWRTTPTDDAHNRGGLAALGDSVFLGTTGERTQFALTAANGAVQWSADVESAETPLLGGGRAYVTEYGGRVTALDPRTGGTLWSKGVAPRLRGQRTYDATNDRVLLVSEGDLLGVDAATGERQWTTRVATDERGNGVHGAVRLADGTAYATSYRNHLVAVDVADGSLQWDRRFEPATVDCRTSGEKRQCARRFTVDAVAGGTLVAAVRRYDDEPDSLLALDARDGSVQWRDTLADAGMSLTKPVVGGRVLYVGVDREEGTASELRRYDRRDGTRVSTTPFSGSLAGDPVVAEERVLLPLRTALVCLG